MNVQLATIKAKNIKCNCFSTEEELRAYRAIGTVEECRAAREKQKSKEVEIGKYYYWCPECGARRSIHQKHKFCHECGQAIKFTESEE